MPTLVAHCENKDEFEKVKNNVVVNQVNQVKEVKRKDPRTGTLAWFARVVFNNPLFFLGAAPALWILFAGIGAANYEVEDQVGSLWSLSRGPYAHDQKYKEDNMKSSSFGARGTSGMLAIAKPRAGGNIMSEAYIDEIAERMNFTEKIEVVHDGVTYTFDDVCFNPIGAYTFPCYRMTPLDCIREGDYDFTPKASHAWRDLFTSGALSTAIATVKTGAVAQFFATAFCPVECQLSGSALMTDWATDTTCMTCVSGFIAGTTATQYDDMFYGALRSSGVTTGIATGEFQTI
jgi:hypothetical protein